MGINLYNQHDKINNWTIMAAERWHTESVSTLFNRDNPDPAHVWYFDRLGYSPD